MELPDALERDLAEVVAQIADLTAERDSIIAAAIDANLDDEHDPDGSTVAFERARVAALLAAATARRAELEQAARRVADGTYGVCERCGRPIGAERAAALPATTTCITCALEA
jgi:RNA polymerase-binding transcription factor DksA